MAIDKELIEEALDKFERRRICGEIQVELPQPPLFRQIDNYDKPKEKQKFYYIEQDKDYDDLDDEAQGDIAVREYNRIKNGYFFFNYGNLEYVTGYHYAFLNYMIIDGEKPLFTDSQRDFFYVWDAVEKDPNCFGLCLTTPRRWGKGEVSIIIAYLRTILNQFSHCGIQSKTLDDAKGLYSKLVQRWQRMPTFLKPIDEGESNPKSSLRFFEPSKRSTKTQKKEYSVALNSWIDFAATIKTAYDGQKLKTYIFDEAAKAENVDVEECWNVVRFCLLNGSRIIGKALLTTTVEDGDSFTASVQYKNIWDKSDPQNKLESNKTQSGLWRYFNPANMGYYGEDDITGVAFIDDYGYSRKDLATGYILRNRVGLDDRQLASEKRKLPLTVEEAFQTDASLCHFNSINLSDQLTYLKEYAPKGLVNRVTFYRKPDGTVTWRNDPKGKFQMCWDFKNQSESNKFIIENGIKKPSNTSSFAIGIDPFASTIITGEQGSNGVAYVYRKHDTADPEDSGLVVCRYADRPPLKSIFHDQIIMMCEYYGCKANYESDVDDYYEYFVNAGYKNFVMWRPKSTIDPNRKNKKTKYGTPSKDPFALQKHFDTIFDYIELHCNKIYFIELIEDLIAYKHIKRTKYDDTVAFGMSLLAGTENVKAEDKTTKLVFMKYAQPIQGMGGR
jgi:hypothetical protein